MPSTKSPNKYRKKGTPHGHGRSQGKSSPAKKGKISPVAKREEGESSKPEEEGKALEPHTPPPSPVQTLEEESFLGGETRNVEDEVSTPPEGGTEPEGPADDPAFSAAAESVELPTDGSPPSTVSSDKRSPVRQDEEEEPLKDEDEAKDPEEGKDGLAAPARDVPSPVAAPPVELPATPKPPLSPLLKADRKTAALQRAISVLVMAGEDSAKAADPSKMPNLRQENIFPPSVAAHLSSHPDGRGRVLYVGSLGPRDLAKCRAHNSARRIYPAIGEAHLKKLAGKTAERSLEPELLLRDARWIGEAGEKKPEESMFDYWSRQLARYEAERKAYAEDYEAATGRKLREGSVLCDFHQKGDCAWGVALFRFRTTRRGRFMDIRILLEEDGRKPAVSGSLRVEGLQKWTEECLRAEMSVVDYVAEGIWKRMDEAFPEKDI